MLRGRVFPLEASFLLANLEALSYVWDSDWWIFYPAAISRRFGERPRLSKTILKTLSTNSALALFQCRKIRYTPTPIRHEMDVSSRHIFPQKTQSSKRLIAFKNDVWVFFEGAWTICILLESLRTTWPPSTFRRLQVTFRLVPPPFRCRRVTSYLYSYGRKNLYVILICIRFFF